MISDGQGLGDGALICTIEGFHWARVEVKTRATELWFEDKVCVAVKDGIVQYSDGQELAPERRQEP
jgi:hypothetical protein